MTIINRRHQRVLLHQSGIDHFWQMLQEHYAGDSAVRWRKLAMLSLRVNSGWSLEQLGFLFGREKAEIARALNRLRKDLRTRFHVQWRSPASRERQRPESSPGIDTPPVKDNPRTPPLRKGGQGGSRCKSERLERQFDARRHSTSKASRAGKNSGR